MSDTRQSIRTAQAGYHVFRCTSTTSTPVARPIDDTLTSAETLCALMDDDSEGCDVCYRARYVTLTELEATRQIARAPRNVKRLKARKCASCKAGGAEIEADDAVAYITGSINDGERSRPYRGYICDSHFDAFVTDGGRITSKRAV